MENADQLKYAIGIFFESPASSQARDRPIGLLCICAIDNTIRPQKSEIFTASTSTNKNLNRSTAYRCCDTVSIPFSSWSICQVTGL